MMASRVTTFLPLLMELETASTTSLAMNLAQVVSEPTFCVTRFVESTLHQRFDPILGGGSTERSDAGIPPGAEFDVRRKTGVDEALGVSDRPLIELGDPSGECIHERIKLGIGQGAIHVAIRLGLVSPD